MELAVQHSRYQLRKMETPSIAFMNRNFIIRWRTADEVPGYTNLISAGRYEEKFGTHYMEKHFTKAVESGMDKITFKIRGLYEITFVSR